MVSDGEDKGTTPVRGRPFKQGESGNPAGRPVGSKSMTKLLMERLDGRAEELIDALIDRALKGDGAATKIISDRVMPVQRGSFVDFDLPERLPDGSMDFQSVLSLSLSLSLSVSFSLRFLGRFVCQSVCPSLCLLPPFPVILWLSGEERVREGWKGETGTQ